MKELNTQQMEAINGGGVLACAAMIAVTAVGIAGGLGAFAIGFFVGSLYAENSPC